MHSNRNTQDELAEKIDKLQEQRRRKELERELQTAMTNMVNEENQEEFFGRLFTKSPNLPMVTDITPREKTQLVQVTWFANTFEQDWLTDLIDTGLAYAISIKRQGRKEAVAAMIGNIEEKSRKWLGWRKEETT